MSYSPIIFHVSSTGEEAIDRRQRRLVRTLTASANYNPVENDFISDDLDIAEINRLVKGQPIVVNDQVYSIDEVIFEDDTNVLVFISRSMLIKAA